MLVPKMRESCGMALRVYSFEARAAEHHRDAVPLEIVRDAAPEQLNGMRIAIGRCDAGAAKFKPFARQVIQRGKVEFGGTVEPAG